VRPPRRSAGWPTDWSCRAVKRWLVARGFSSRSQKVAPREPSIRFRKTVPTCWIGLELVEGKNRQVRRMTAAIGHPTLRLIRVRMGEFGLGGLAAGTWRELKESERRKVLG